MLDKTLRGFLARLRLRAGLSRAKPARRTLLRMEALEAREVPANNVLHWVGENGGEWSVANNWYDETTSTLGDMKPSDDPTCKVVFGGTVTGITIPLTGLSVNDDTTEVANMTVTSDYQGKILLDVAPDSRVEVSNTLQMDGGTVYGPGAGNLLSASLVVFGTLNWTGGRFDSMMVAVGNADHQSVAGNLSGGTKELAAAGLALNYGVTGWSGGNINIVAPLDGSGPSFVANNGTFDIQTSASIQNQTSSLVQVANTGTLKKTTNVTTTISVGIFTNAGTMLLQNGTLNVAVPGLHADQTEASQITPGSLTSFEGGNLTIADGGTYYVYGGTVRGAGTLTGSLQNGYYVDGSPPTVTPGGTIMPGTSSTGGTMTVTGHFYNVHGTVRLNVFGLSNYGKLQVNGNAYLYENTGSTLWIDNVPLYPSGSVGLPVFTYSSVTGNFANVTITNTAWTGYTAEADKTSTVYAFLIWKL